jgi:hypothetical protein
VIDLDDLRPKAQREYQDDPDTITVTVFSLADVNEVFLPYLPEIFIDTLYTPVETEIYPYRFGAQEYLALAQNDINGNLMGHWYFLHFSDSIRTDNALLNWLDCFGSDCQSVELKSKEPILENTGAIWTTKQEIIVFINQKGYSMSPKELLKMSKFIQSEKRTNPLRYEMKWTKNQAAEWSGSRLR